MSQTDVAIVGMECVLPGAKNLAEYWENLVAGVDAIREIPRGRLNATNDLGVLMRPGQPPARGGFLPEGIRFHPLKFGVMPNIVPHGDPDQFLMLHVLDGALRDAGVEEQDAVRARTDVIIGRGGYLTNKMSEIYCRCDLVHHLLAYLARRFPEWAQGEQLERIAEQMRGALGGSDADSLSTCIPNLVASRAANRLNLRGAAYTVDAACASSLLAVQHAVDRLRGGVCDLALAGGIFLCQTPTFWTLFMELGAMSPSLEIRPFDRRADGLLIGEGAGAVALKRLDDAVRDGDRVYAIIKGVGVSSDGRDTHILSPSSRGQIEALQNAYRDAGVDPASVGYLEAHGTGTVAGDLAELETIKRFYGTRGRFPPVRAMGSVKSMIGHTMPAAGIASLVKVALSLSNKCLLPSLHCDEPRAELEDASFYVNRETRPWIHDTAAPPRRAGINAFGFGGINVHVVLEEVPVRAPAGKTPIPCRPHNPGKLPTELVVFSGESAEELSGRLERVERFLGAPEAEPALEDVAFTAAEEVDFDHPCKLALVATDVGHLQRLIAASLARLEQDGTDLGDLEHVYYSEHASGPIGKVAGIFPGVGFPGLIGGYPGHLMELCRYLPEVRQEFDKVERRDRHPDDPVPTSLIFLPPSSLPDDLQSRLRNRIAAMKVIEGADEKEITIEPWDRNIAAACVTLSNWISWVVLRKLGLPVDMVCGQSQGEIAAICAAGMLDIDEVTARLWQALAVSPRYAGRGRLAFVAASEEELAPYLAEAPETSVAIHIAPEMLIVGGTDAHILDLTVRLREQGMIANPLPYPPIHTPRLSHMRQELKQIIDMDFRFRKPGFTIYSAITASPFPEGEEAIRELALDNLDRPVRFWQTIQRMYDDGARVFLQVGGGTLASNIKSILPRPDIVGTAVDVDHRHPITQLHHMCALLWTSGIRFNLSCLYEYGSRKRLDFDTPSPPANSATKGIPLRMDFIPFSAGDVEKEDEPMAVANPAPEQSVAAAAPPQPQSASEVLDGPGATVPEDFEPAAITAGETLMPFVGQVVHYVAGQEIVTERVLDLDEDRFLQDHVLIDEGSGKPVENRMPVLPMTMILEAMGETAACLVPGLGLIGFEKITAFRWIDFRDRRTLCLRVRGQLESADAETGVCRIRCEVFSDGRSSASATVLLSDAYREDVRLQFTELAHPRAWPLTAEEIYTERHMFHGPTFRCVTGLHALGDQGLLGEITVGPKDRLFASLPDPHLLVDPVVLDGVAQLVGMWAIMHGVFLMPARITKLELYRPTPPPGTKVPVRVEIRQMSTEQRTVTADAEVQDGEGSVWLRFQGVNEWLYDYSPQLQNTQRLPTRYHLATPNPLPGGREDAVFTLLARSDLRHANLEWLARLFLHQSEWLYLDSLDELHQKWRWLMGRIAVKDAVRLYLAARTGGPMLHPALILIVVDESGKPSVHPLEGVAPMPAVSIAHTDDWAAAVAAEHGCGIDIEPVGRDTEGILGTFAGDDEIALIHPLLQTRPDGRWATRLWCAKEAVAKALGTGLKGRPKDFEAIDAEEDGRLLVRYRPTGLTFPVRTSCENGLVVAFASLVESGPEAELPDAAGRDPGRSSPGSLP